MFVIHVLAESFLPVGYATYKLIKNKQNSKALQYALSVILLVVFSMGAIGTLNYISKATPHIYDQAICAIEYKTHMALPALVGAFYFISVRFFSLFNFIYGYILLFVFIISSSEVIYSPTSLKNNILVQFAIGGGLSTPLYLAVPAVGPVFFTNFIGSFHLPDTTALNNFPMLFTEQNAYRNSMPSLHATWVILCLLALRKSPFLHRVLGILYVAVTFIFTLGYGFHYLLDWIVAFPLILFIRSLTSDHKILSVRLTSLIVSATYILCWIYILRNVREFINLDLFLYILIASTLIIPTYLEYKLYRQENNEFARKTTDAAPFYSKLKAR